MAAFFNQATLSYSGNTVSSNITEGQIIDALTAAKTAVVPEYEQGGTVTYIISLVNDGTADYTGLTLTDDLGAYEFGTAQVTPLDYTEDSVRYFVNGQLQAAPTVSGSSPLTITGINVPAGGNALVIYETTANSFASPEAGGEITNTVTVSGTPITAPITAEEAVSAVSQAQLTITKALSPTEVSAGEEITYTFTVLNNGSTALEAADNAVITDTFDPALSGIEVTLDGAPLPSASYTYDESTGLFTTAAGVITLPAAQITQDHATGQWSVIPSQTVLTVSGTI